jgi:hypothetical protein
MCTLFYACSRTQVNDLLVGFAIFVLLMVLVVGLIVVGIEYERRKRTGVDLGHIDQIIKDARKRAYDRGRQHEN